MYSLRPVGEDTREMAAPMMPRYLALNLLKRAQKDAAEEIPSLNVQLLLLPQMNRLSPNRRKLAPRGAATTIFKERRALMGAPCPEMVTARIR